VPETAPGADLRRRTDELIAYHGPIAHRLTSERTSYASQMIPVTSYILVACAEVFTRYPEMMRVIDAAMPAEEIGRAGRRPGSQVNSVYLWSIANFFLLGRKVFTQFDPGLDDPEAAFTVLDFWERAAKGFRGDGTRMADDAGGVVRVYDQSIIDQLIESAVTVTDDERTDLIRFNATLVNWLFLLYFDTRVGTGDTGPYDLGDGRTLLVRDYYRLGQSDFPWSDVAADAPYDHLIAGYVLEGIDELTITDFGSCRTSPEHYLDGLVGFSLFTTDGCETGSVRPVDLSELDEIATAARRAQAAHYRNIASMTRDEMVTCGAYVYFTFLRPFAEVAGVADELDWTVPRDLIEPVYEMLVQVGMEVGDQMELEDDPALYYLPLA
jgi:hypothetical protein